MREIKVKAWNKAIKQMQEVTQITFIGDGNIASVTVSTEKINGHQDENTYFADAKYQDNDLSNIELLWFTGLYDKYSFEIFDGDIMKSSIDIVYHVHWDFENGRFLGRTTDNRIIYVAREPKAAIIGNIYENPELLEMEIK